MVGADFFCERGSYRTRSTKTLLFSVKLFYISHAVCYFYETLILLLRVVFFIYPRAKKILYITVFALGS